MSDRETQEILLLQQRIAARLAELDVPPGDHVGNVVHHLAEIAVLGRNFAEQTLPLFLSVSTDHRDAIAQLAVSLKCDLDLIRDAITDLEADLVALMQFLNRENRNQ